MSDHSLSPVTAQEVEALLDRLSELRTRVLTSTEWYSLLSAARQLLARDGKKRVLEPAEMNLVAHSSTTAGRVLSALIPAFASRDTYLANRRYNINQWIFLIREFYALSPYVLPPRGLDYAAELLREARKSDKDGFWMVASIMVRSEPMAIRQSVKNEEVDVWEGSILDRLRALKKQGAAFLRASQDEESIDPDEYEDWLYWSEDILAHANEFLRAFQRPLPTEIDDLKSLVKNVPRPSVEDEVDSDDDETLSAQTSNYWTIERIFEDL